MCPRFPYVPWKWYNTAAVQTAHAQSLMKYSKLTIDHNFIVFLLLRSLTLQLINNFLVSTEHSRTVFL
jgi:hypothetical protein